MNILLTNTCNRRCPYCFAAERISYTIEEEGEAKPAPKFISRGDFEAAVAFAVLGRQPVVGLLGGEPSLHPEFVDLLLHAVDAGIRPKVFTNGMFPKKHLERLVALEPQQRRFTFIVNLNHPDITSAREREAQERLFEAMPRDCQLSCNIYDSDLDLTYLVETITRFGLRRHIRIAAAQPLADRDSRFVPVERYRDLAPPLLELAAAADAEDITVGFDCGFTLCMFTEAELGKLMVSGCRFKASCGPAIDVGTDLSVWSCFPLSTLTRGVRLGDFETMDDLAGHFGQTFKRLFSTGALEDCVDCRHLRRRQCTGGCAAHVYRSFNP